jgi:hypothetical protein
MWVFVLEKVGVKHMGEAEAPEFRGQVILCRKYLLRVFVGNPSATIKSLRLSKLLPPFPS